MWHRVRRTSSGSRSIDNFRVGVDRCLLREWLICPYFYVVVNFLHRCSLLFLLAREVFSQGQMRRVLRLDDIGCPVYRQIGD